MMSKIKDLEETIKYKFNSKDLLIKSLTHKSYDENTNNEKLVNDPIKKFKGPFSGILFSTLSLFLILSAINFFVNGKFK